MPFRIFGVLLLLAVSAVEAGTTAPPPRKPTLEGYYRLRAAGQTEYYLEDGMLISRQIGNAFTVAIDKPTGTPRYDWSGKGTLDGRSGFYDWQFGDGKKGRTTFTVDAEGRLHGKVRGAGIDWDYVAEPLGETRTIEKFKVAGFQFQGNTLVPTADLLELARPYQDRDITLQDLSDLLEALRNLHVQRGHSATAVEMLPQRMRPGEHVIIDIKEPTRPAQRPAKK